MSELYRDFIDGKADEIINSLGGTITPAPANAELYRDFLDRKFDDVINAIGNVKVKSFTYTGTGTITNTINIPSDYSIILDITGKVTNYNDIHLLTPYCKGNRYMNFIYTVNTTSNRYYNTAAVTDTNNSLYIHDSNNIGSSAIANLVDQEYTVYYI